MKKIALLIVILPLFALGQTYKKAINNNNYSVAPLKQVPLNIDNSVKTSPLVQAHETPEYMRITGRSSKYSPLEIGSTQYGLQTNASVARRIIVYADGKKSATWTTSPDESPFTRRGTGYNHYNGTTWFPSLQTRIEVDRAGWPNIGKVNKAGTDVEYVISHYSSSVATDPSGGIILNINGGVGMTNWTQTFLDKASGPIWHRSAESGDYVCVISSYSDTNKYVNGMRMPTVYSRYKVSTATFDKKYVLLPGCDTSIYKRGSADDYAMDANGKTVAIIFAPNNGHVVVWKSEDSGATFKKIMVDSIVVPKPQFPGDTQYYDYPDGSVSIIVDNEGYCKAVWSFYTGFRYTNANDSIWYNRFKHGIIYWNEKTGSKSKIPTAKVWDRNGNDSLDAENGWLYTRTVGTTRYSITGYGSTNDLLTFPQITIDNSGNIFVIYSAIIEKAFYSIGNDANGVQIKENLRDVYVVYSKDQGLTWGPQQNLTNNPNMEDVFASVSKNCYGDKLHIIFQEDEDPGTDVQNGDDPTVNLEYYMEVPISDILGNLVGPGDSIQQPNSVSDQKKSFEIGNNYPNPFTGETYVNIKLNKVSNVVVTMNNTLGQQVLESRYSNVSSGISTLSIDASSLQSGIYFLNVRVGNDVKTIKTMIR
jgi:hypothetical protein